VNGLTLQCVIYREDSGFVAQCLNVDVASEGATEDEARTNLTEALELYFSDPHAATALATVADAHVDQVTLRSA
jgi:predicted RNase H-like HicB family nuclease